ncbi:hypothetical protein C5167_000167 [Papaver somniferum]|uniref:Uncharacterized protein n=1 Tax=Papaver somniferum TaxID=3469 RepID=A0A4Y7KVR1_PAPSO|nr:cingulin-like [Papaver somniferum]RZC76019.1 hypothetical protein C5167_000167 [Papaver somniferum]
MDSLNHTKPYKVASPQPDPSVTQQLSPLCGVDPPRTSPNASSPGILANKGKLKAHEELDPAYIPDMKFLRKIFISIRRDPSLRSAAIESLTSFSSEDFITEDQSFIENASFNLSSQQHAAIMDLERNRSMTHLVELKLSREGLEKFGARIYRLTQQLSEREKQVNDLQNKLEKLSEREKQMGDLRRYEQEIRNQISLLSRENGDLSKKVSTLEEDVKLLNEDCDQMEKDATNLAKRIRRNAQDDKVRFFNEFGDSRSIPLEPLDLEVFSDDEPQPISNKQQSSSDEATESNEGLHSGDESS